MYFYSNFIYYRKCYYGRRFRILRKYLILIDYNINNIIKYIYEFFLKENIYF